MNYKISEKQLEELIEKLDKNIHKITDKKGESGMDISQSVKSTINHYLNKKCSPEFELKFCPFCLQMTNHIENICQKHKQDESNDVYHELSEIKHYAETALKSLDNRSLSEVRGMLEGILEKSNKIIK